VDFIAFAPRQVDAGLRLFAGRTRQYVFVSSASAYRKPPVHHLIDESTPLSNPFWQYARDKIACEALLAERAPSLGLNVTIVRPSHTYGDGWIPNPFRSSDFTVAQRMLDGRRIVVHGDGQSLWTLTHASDFAVGLVGLLGNPAAFGEAVQIMGDEVLTWESIHSTIAQALGAEPRIVHVPSDFIARVDPEAGSHLLGDKTYSSLFDCSKLKRLVPEFATTVPFHRGIRASIEWLMADPRRRKTDPSLDAAIDKVLSAWDALGRSE
jgi:nucleoside-diphosphate-sugar epimerase